jgi:iron complex transport system ATP-binding protein
LNLVLENLSVAYGAKTVVQNVSAALASGTVCGLIGPNGAGKSTLLKALAGLLPATGNARCGNRSLGDMDAAERACKLAYLAQSPESAWPISVNELVGLGRLPYRKTRHRDDESAHVAAALHKTATAHLAQRRTEELSGGELARVQLARALCVSAPILLTDEPTAKLDPYHQLHIMDLLRKEAESDRLVVTVLHDLTLAARYCDRLLLLDGGRLIADGSPREVLTAETLRTVYRVESIIGEHQAQALVIPWRRCQQHTPDDGTPQH